MSDWEYTVETDDTEPEPEPEFDSEAAIARYQQAMIQLLPPGFAWSKDVASRLGTLLGALAVEFARIDEAADAVLRNANPLTVDEYIDDWEEALDLPGSCVGTPSTDLDERRGAIATKLRGRTSHSLAAFQAAATDLGYGTITVNRYTPFSVGSSAVGDAVWGDDWMYVVDIEVPYDGQTANDQLTCIYQHELARAHALVSVTFV